MMLRLELARQVPPDLARAIRDVQVALRLLDWRKRKLRRMLEKPRDHDATA